MAYNLEDGTPSFVIEVDFLKGEKGDTGFSPRIEIASLTSAEYILKVINEDGEFLTPNLKSDLSLDDYVLKEEGKGLSTNSFENEEKQKLQELHNYDDTELRSQVSGLAESIGKINSFDVKVVDELPTENIDVHTIYFVPNEQEDDNYYDEFLYVNSRWEHIGTSKVDLSNYATLQQIEELRQGQEELNQAQQELMDDLGKTYKDTNITAPTVAGWGRIKKLYGRTVEEGTGEKSPDNPYMLKSVGDDVNLFDMKWINTTLPTEIGFLLTNKEIGLSSGDYCFWVKLEDGIMLNDSDMGISFWNGDTRVLILGAGDTVNITQEQASVISSLRLYFANTSYAGKKIKEIKLHKGSVTTPYSPYGYGTIQNISTDETNTSSNVAYVDKPLCSVGDVRDEIDYTNGKITRRCGYVVLNGRENVSGQNGQYYVLVNCAYGVINAICSHYTKTKDWDEHGSSGDNFIVYRHEGWAQGRFSFKDTTFSNVTEFKTYLAEQYAKGTPVTVIYELPTPTIEDIDCSDKIVQYADSTNVYNRDGAEIEVSLNNSEAISDINENFKNIEETKSNLKTIDIDVTTPSDNNWLKIIDTSTYGIDVKKIKNISIRIETTYAYFLDQMYSRYYISGTGIYIAILLDDYLNKPAKITIFYED